MGEVYLRWSLEKKENSKSREVHHIRSIESIPGIGNRRRKDRREEKRIGGFHVEYSGLYLGNKKTLWESLYSLNI